MTSTDRRWRPVGLRREAAILLPVAFFLLVLLSVFTLLSYRSGVALLVEERRGEALLLARRVAAGAADRTLGELDLRQAAPGARGVAVVDSRGRTVGRAGSLPEGPLLAPLGEPPAGEEGQGVAVGPGGVAGDAVTAFAPLADDAGGWVRVDLGAPALALQQRGLRVLTWLVLGVDAALVVLVILFLGRMLEPYEALLERARTAGAVPRGSEDEVAFLLGTFERALEALARPRRASEGDSIEALQRTLAASFESGMLLLDRHGRVLALNPTGAQLLEMDPVEVEPRRGETPRALGEVLEGYPGLGGLVAEAAAGGRGVRRREIEVATPSGRALTLGLTVHPLRTAAEPGEEAPAGTPRGYLVLFVDLTEVRRRAEQARLAENLQDLGELAAGVAHELRNSLATLKGYLTLIERAERSRSGRPETSEGGPGGERDDAAAGAVREYLHESRREADHLQRVLEDFLSFARPGTARLEAVNLYQVLARAAADPALAAVPVRLSPPPPGGFHLSGDPQLLERAFRNLLHNAVEAAAAAETKEPVEVTARPTDEAVEVTVADRGPGVPEEVRERLFRPFASGRSGGVGLGLALARRIVVLHGGRLEIEDRLGGGTVARVLLPAGRIVTEGNSNPGPDRDGPEESATAP